MESIMIIIITVFGLTGGVATHSQKIQMRDMAQCKAEIKNVDQDYFHWVDRLKQVKIKAICVNSSDYLQNKQLDRR